MLMQVRIPPSSEETPDLKSQGEQWGLGVTEPAVMGRMAKFVTSALQETFTFAIGEIIRAAAWIAIRLATLAMKAEDRNAAAFRDLTNAAIKDLTGIDNGNNRAAIGRQIMEALSGGPGAPSGGALGPSTTGAEKYMELVMTLALEGYVEGGITSALSVGFLDKFTELDDILAQVLGLGRMSRRVMQPLMNARVITPMQWHVNQTYRPELLSVAEAVRQFYRGRWTRAQLDEELARQGWSDARIDAHVNAGRKFFSAADVRQFINRAYWSRETGFQHLRDQGYDDQAAEDALRLEGLNRIEQLENQEAALLITAYANRDIDRGIFLAELGTRISSPTERALFEELGELRRTINVRFLSSSEARRLAAKGVLSVVDYRRALEHEGYDPFAVTALEIELRFDLDQARSIEEHRRELAEERAREAAAREAERAARKAEIEQERALRRRGPLADLERAAVRGLIPFARVEEVYAADYDPDTVAILIDLLEADRQTYLDQQAAAAAAKQRAARRNVDIGTLEDAVLLGQLDLDRYRQRLAQLGFVPEDVELLARVLEQRRTDQATAKRLRDDAAARAQRTRIDLGRFERMVRLGVQSMDAYARLLTDLGFDDGQRAAMQALLEQQIAEDRRADQARRDAEAKLRTRGLSLEQFRRAVILHHKTVDQFTTFLVNEGFTADAVATLVAEVQDAVADADAARSRRTEAERARLQPSLPLSTVSRAARLGMIPPTVYEGRLHREGYSAEDIAIEMGLLLTEIADVQAARRRRDELEAEQPARELSLAQVERAVKVGVVTIEDYRSRAAILGYAPEDVALLVDVLETELATLTEARARRETVNGELATRNLSLAALEQSVKEGLITVDDYIDRLTGLGYTEDDAALLTALLETELNG